MRTPELPEHSLASPLSLPRSLVLRALQDVAAMVAAVSSRFGRHCSSSSKRLTAQNPLPPASPPSTWPRALLPGFPSPPVRVAAGAVAAADACARGQANPARLQPN